MLAAYASALILVLGSVAVGRALSRALGPPRTTWVEPVTGFAVLAVAASASAEIFDSGEAAAITAGILVAASLAYLRGQILPGDDLRLAAAPALVAAGLASLPFLASQRLGILGVGINNDLAAHLLWAEWLRDQADPTPVGLATGYPVGPHSLAAALGESLGFAMTEAFAGLLIAIAVLSALTALGLLRGLAPARRTIGCGLVALPYMAASALALGGFKETAMGLILLGFAVALSRLEREFPGDPALLVSLGLLAAGSITVYSYPGLYWLLAAGGLMAVAGAARALRRREGWISLRRHAAVLAVPLATLAVAGAAELPRVVDFNQRSGADQTIEGNSKLTEAVSPLEALGAWPDGNFLAGIDGPPAHLLFGALGIAALLAAVPWWLRRGSLAIPLAALGAAVIYLGTLAAGGLYVQAKALAVPAALLMLLMVRPLLDRDGAARAALAAGFVAVAGLSSFLALRDAVVAPGERAGELAAVRERTGGEPVLYLTADRFTDYELRSTRVASPFLSAQNIVPSRDGKDYVLPLDFDSPTPETLDRFRWVLVTRGAYRSQPPPNLTRVLKTDSYELWERTGPTPLETRVMDEAGRPGVILDCDQPDRAAREALASARAAEVFALKPVVNRPEAWRPSSELSAGEAATATLPLPAGRWLLSLQYQSPLRGVFVEAGGEEFELPPSLDGALPGRLGPYWRVGEVGSTGEGVDLTVRVDELSPLQKLLGVGRRATIGNVAAVAAEPDRPVTIREACGAYLDHYSLPPDAVDPAQVRRERRRAAEGVAGHFRPPELAAAHEAASD